MSGSYRKPVAEPPLVEWTTVRDVPVDGIAPVKSRGDHVHLVFWAEHTRYDGSDEIPERAIVARLVMTPACYERMLRQLQEGPPIVPG